MKNKFKSIDSLYRKKNIPWWLTVDWCSTVFFLAYWFLFFFSLIWKMIDEEYCQIHVPTLSVVMTEERFLIQLDFGACEYNFQSQLHFPHCSNQPTERRRRRSRETFSRDPKHQHLLRCEPRFRSWFWRTFMNIYDRSQLFKEWSSISLPHFAATAPIWLWQRAVLYWIVVQSTIRGSPPKNDVGFQRSTTVVSSRKKLGTLPENDVIQ